MLTEEYIVDLDLNPKERWSFLMGYREEIDELITCYLKDFEGAEMIFQSIDLLKEQIVSKEYLEEIEFIASISSFSPNQILIANLYYDILKFYFGCTAFVFVNKEKSIFHARNLDWHSENDLLSRNTMVFNFQKNGKTLYKSIGWPGFIGVLSGTKPGKFSVTLNAVLSDESPQIASPISFFLRDVLTEVESYKDARDKLEKTLIASDCLLLLSGVSEEEKVVIERTPTRFASRETDDRFIVVTNDYKKLENNLSLGEENILQSTSCGRYDRAIQLLNQKQINNKDSCLNVLNDDNIKMNITAQQMIFDNITGDILVIKT